MNKPLAVSIVVAAVVFGVSDPVSRLMAEEGASTQAAARPVAESLYSGESEVVPGADVLVSRVTIPPNSGLPWHWHPGEEYSYVLAGSATLSMEGGEEVSYSAGEFMMVPHRRIHMAETGDEGATVLVFRVHQHGQPERVMIE